MCATVYLLCRYVYNSVSPVSVCVQQCICCVGMCATVCLLCRYVYNSVSPVSVCVQQCISCVGMCATVYLLCRYVCNSVSPVSVCVQQCISCASVLLYFFALCHIKNVLSRKYVFMNVSVPFYAKTITPCTDALPYFMFNAAINHADAEIKVVKRF
jgi:hypothetical protein